MVKTNYQAWHIHPESISSDWSDDKKLELFAKYGVLAPSGHNTQPWKLQLDDNTLWIAIHPDHHLSIDGSGLLSVEPYISLGTFIETMELAALGHGYSLHIQLFPKRSYIAAITVKNTVKALPELLEAITRRVSNRNAYDTTPIDPKTLQDIMDHQLALVQATSVSTRPDIEFVAAQTETAIGSIMGNPLYRQELSKWVRTNQTRKFDGMPGFTHGFGSMQALVSRAAVRYAPGQGPQAKKSGNLIRKSAALVIVRCSDDSQDSFVNAGRLYARICIRAQAAGYATSALGAAVLDGVTRETVKKHFGLSDRPIYILRIGKATSKARHSPRWPLHKVLSRVND